MGYNKSIEVDLDKCEILSGVAETNDDPGSVPLNVWMFREQRKPDKTLVSYVVCCSQGKKFISDALYVSSDFIRLKFIQKKTSIIYIDTENDTYFFDLDFLWE